MRKFSKTEGRKELGNAEVEKIKKKAKKTLKEWRKANVNSVTLKFDELEIEERKPLRINPITGEDFYDTDIPFTPAAFTASTPGTNEDQTFGHWN